MTTRADLSEVLTLDPSEPTKTFVVEVHPEGNAEDLLSEIAGKANLRPTEDAYLYRLEVPDADDCFWVDQLDERFWNFHTTMSTAMASRYLKQRVASRHELDWVWLPSDHLRTVWPDTHVRGVRAKFEGSQLLGGAAPVDDVRLKLSGRSADFFLEYLYQNAEIRSAVPFDGVQVDLDDPDFGSVHEAVDRMGRFAVSGDSLEFHLQFVQTVIDRYRHLVTACEQKAIEWAAFDPADDNAGGRYLGAPIVIRFSRPIPDLEQFTDALFSSREPFRLWGAPRIEPGIAEIEAVDLHIGQPVNIDIGDQWMRVYLRRGCCGNSMARLASNLQHRFDSALTFADPTLQSALMGIAPAMDGQRPAALPGSRIAGYRGPVANREGAGDLRHPSAE
jgi:hypothetical protein